MSFTPEQVEQLLHPINPTRVLKDGKGHAHVSQQDVLAHLIRVFGFGNFDTEVMSADLIFEAEKINNPGRWDVCYRAMVRLTVRDPDGGMVCSFENGSTATAQNQTRGDAHDLAYKSAISLSVKRAAIALGDQFGLSLYNKGQMSSLVMGTMVGRGDQGPVGAARPRDMQDGVPQQVSLGNDEIEADAQPVEEPKPPTPKASPATRTMSRQRPPQTDGAAAPTLPSEGVTPPAAAASPETITDAQLKKLHTSFTEAGIKDRDKRLTYVANILGVEVVSSKDLTKAQAHKIIESLATINEAPFGDEPPMSGDRDE